MLALLMATGAEDTSPVAVGQFFIIRGMGVMAADTIDQITGNRIHVGAFEHAVQMGSLHFFMALHAQRLQVTLEQALFIAGMGQMTIEAILFSRNMLELLLHHALIMAGETESRLGLAQYAFSGVGMGGVTVQAALFGKNRLMLDFLPKVFFLGLGMAFPAHLGNRFLEGPTSTFLMASGTFPFAIWFVLDGVQGGLGPLESAMGIMAGEAVGP